MLKTPTDEPGHHFPDPVGVSEVNEAGLATGTSHPLLQSVVRTLHALFDPEKVLESVFKNLDVKTVKKLRLVCHLWKESVSRNLSKENGGVGLGIRFSNKKTSAEKKRLKEFPQILDSASKDFFKTAYMFDWDPLLRPPTNNRVEILLPLPCYLGLVNLHLEAPLQSKVLLLILNEYCPSLETLKIQQLTQKESIPQQTDLVFQQPLKLKAFSFSYYVWENPGGVEKNLLGIGYDDLLAAVIQASPQLTSLNCNGFNPGFTTQVFRLMKTNSLDILKNFQKLTLMARFGRNELSPFHELVGIKFKNLKDLTIGNMCSTPDTSQFLNEVRGSLEKLILWDSETWNTLTTSELVLPTMANLNEFRCKLKFLHYFKGIDFLNHIPRLKLFFLVELVGEMNKNIRNEADTKWFIPSFAALVVNPHRNLTSLYLLGVVASSELIRVIALGAPNVSILLIHSSSTKDKSVVELKMFSEMRNIRHLNLVLDSFEPLTKNVADMTFSMQQTTQGPGFRPSFINWNHGFSIKNGYGRFPTPNWLKNGFLGILSLEKLILVFHQSKQKWGQIESYQSLLEGSLSVEFSDISPMSPEDCLSTHYEYLKVGEHCKHC